MHPLIRFLKRRSPLYNEALSSGSPIRQECSKFLWNKDTQEVTYYGSDKSFSQLLNENKIGV